MTTTDEEGVAILIEGAKTFPDNMLVEMFIENLERALKLNNSGLFKVAGILMDELDRRGFSNAEFRSFRELLRIGVAEAESRRPATR